VDWTEHGGRWRRRTKWFVDETYVESRRCLALRVSTRRQHGQVIDVYVSGRRDASQMDSRDIDCMVEVLARDYPLRGPVTTTIVLSGEVLDTAAAQCGIKLSQFHRRDTSGE
jgi:hypothetical protein